MKRKLLYLLLLTKSLLPAQQELNFELSSGGVQKFDQHIFVFGLRENGASMEIRIYKLDNGLRVKDSLFHSIPKSRAEDFLPITSDTLHNNLSIHIQKKSESRLFILRCKSSLEKIAFIENVEIQRLNNREIFPSSPYYYRNTVYAIRQTSDSGVKQFYLDKYSLLSEKQNYDYKPEWQWAFEKKDMSAASVIFADQLSVYLFAWRVNEGNTSQWFLKIDSKTGVLKRAVKLNTKTEDAFYQFGAACMEPGKNVYITGQKFLRNKDGRPPCETKDPVLYLIEIDTLTEIVSRSQFNVGLPKISGTQKCTSNLLRFDNFIKEPGKDPAGEIDLFRTEIGSSCFFFQNSFSFTFQKAEDQYHFKTSPILNQPALTGILNTRDKLDMNGKICPDENVERLYTAPLILPIKVKSEKDSLDKMMWLLTKTDVRKKSKEFSILKLVKSIYQVQPVEKFKLEQNARAFVLPEKKFLISSYSPDGKLHLKLYNW